MRNWQAWALMALTLTACSKEQTDPVAFLPKQVAADGTDLEALRVRYCHGQNVDLEGELLTDANFKAVFDCANYDGKLSQIGPLFTNKEFPGFLKNINAIMASDSTQDIKETLRDWLEEGPEGTSRADRLLPVLASVIKNPSFQDGLPVLTAILNAGNDIWFDLMPSLAEVLYQERYPDNFDQLFNLFKNSGDANSTEKYSEQVKDWARFLKMDVQGQTVALRLLELGDEIRHLKMKNTSPQEYLDQMTIKNVFLSLYMENGAVRGEMINPKLNADPEDASEAPLTPEQRRIRAYKKLFARGANGERAPIMDLIALVDEFQQPHADFVPALGRWFDRNGPRLVEKLNEYVLRAQVLAGLPKLKVSDYLTEYAEEKEIDTDEPMDEDDFVKFLGDAFKDAKFGSAADDLIEELNTAQLGAKNARLLKGSKLGAEVKALYAQTAVAEYGREIYKVKPAPSSLSSAIRKFNNLHRNASLEVGGVKDTLEQHLLNAWWTNALEALGENVVLDFAMPLVQTIVKDISEDFSKSPQTLSEWYFGSPYANPATTESLAGYAFKELGALEKFNKHKGYLLGELADEIFSGGPDPEQDAANKRAFKALVSQLPNIWLYWKSGMSRSGNDLTRAMASKDKGYLIKNYVAILVSAYQTGFAEKAVDLLSAYQNAFPSIFDQKSVEDNLEERTRVSDGADALKRVLNAMFRPEVKGRYETSTLGKMLPALEGLVVSAKRPVVEKFLLTSADELLRTPDEKIDDFFRDFTANAKPTKKNFGARVETLRSISDAMKKREFPTLMRQLNTFFQDGAVKPALDYIVSIIDDGKLKDVIRFVGRVLGFRK